MGKSSSSVKRKSSKYSSQGRSKKRSKTRRSKVKKLPRRRDSVSLSDDDSTSSVSHSSSSSSDVRRNRRSRLRSRKDVKGRKKRARSPSSSSEGSPYPRKRMRSKKDDTSAAKKRRSKKKNQGKKLNRRGVNISSTSSESSCNCSACQSSSSSSSDESEYNRHNGRSGRRDNYKRKSEKTKFESERRYTRSCSSCSGHSGGNDYAYGEQVNYEDNTKRLRSVITRINEDKEGEELEMDNNKEEMVYDHDDYPLCRSNDSNDGDHKRESAHCSHATSKKMPSDNEEKEGSPKIDVPGHTERNKDGVVKHGRSRSVCDRTETVNPKNEISMTDGTMDGEELESILRRKALENLRIFRGNPGGFQTDSNSLMKLKDEGMGTREPLSNAVVKSGQIEFPRDNTDGSVPEDFTCSLQNAEISADNTNGVNELASVKNKINSPARVVAGIEKIDTANASGTNKSRLVTSSPRGAVLSAVTKQTEASDSEKSDHAKLVAPHLAFENDGAQSVETKPHPVCSGNDNSGRASTNTASVSTTAEPSSCHTPAAAGDESKEGSKFEQKTMCVMRGGEMVQVSYKVYIPPKKTPAARRQLNR